MTERDLFQFDSIFDLLTRLGFTEDQEHERMVAPGGTHMVAFAQIGGRSVAEFVRWGMENGLLVPYLAQPPPTAAERAPCAGSPALKSPTCPNMNHRRANGSNSPVRHCPSCGAVVNWQIPTKDCHADSHARQRRQRNTFCLDCGTRLIT